MSDTEREYSDSELLDHLRELADGEDAPSQREVEQSDGPHPSTYVDRFGSWNGAARAAGLGPNTARRDKPRAYSDSELLDHLRELADGDNAPSQREIRASDGPHPSTYLRRFTSWNAAARAAGLDPNIRGISQPARFSRDELLDQLREVADDGHAPKMQEMKENDGPHPTTYRRQFGSWSEAVEEAGLKLAKRNRRRSKPRKGSLARKLWEADAEEVLGK